jgi:hypothetical protein
LDFKRVEIEEARAAEVSVNIEPRNSSSVDRVKRRENETGWGWSAAMGSGGIELVGAAFVV